MKTKKVLGVVLIFFLGIVFCWALFSDYFKRHYQVQFFVQDSCLMLGCLIAYFCFFTRRPELEKEMKKGVGKALLRLSLYFFIFLVGFALIVFLK